MRSYSAGRNPARWFISRPPAERLCPATAVRRDGRIVDANMSDYLVAVSADVAALDAEFRPAEDTIAGPLGVKGLGELVMFLVPAAIANAVFSATGKRITEHWTNCPSRRAP